jgi:hypothetical protein
LDSLNDLIYIFTELWTMYKAYLFVGGMSKIHECVVWFDDVDSENLMACLGVRFFEI